MLEFFAAIPPYKVLGSDAVNTNSILEHTLCLRSLPLLLLLFVYYATRAAHNNTIIQSYCDE